MMSTASNDTPLASASASELKAAQVSPVMLSTFALISSARGRCRSMQTATWMRSMALSWIPERHETRRVSVSPALSAREGTEGRGE